MTLLWDTDPSAVERYRFALGGEVEQIGTAPLIVRALQDRPGLALVVVGPDIPLEAVGQLTERARVERPDLGVVLVRHRLDVTALAQALRYGVREVVPADDQNLLADAARRSRALSAQLSGPRTDASGAPGRIVTVFSAKGGVGKTTLATNLATYLALTKARVLLVDLDLMFGDVAISLQLLPTRSMYDVVAMRGHLDEQGLGSVVTRHEPSGLDVLAAPADPGDAEKIPGPVLTELLQVAKKVYDVVVIDTPPCFTDGVLAAFDESDLSVLVATLDIPAVKNLRIALQTLDELGALKETRSVVLNRADLCAGLRAEDVETALKHPIASRIPNHVAVQASVNKGTPIVVDDPKHPVSVAIRELADVQIRQRFGLSSDTLAPSRRLSRRWARR